MEKWKAWLSRQAFWGRTRHKMVEERVLDARIHVSLYIGGLCLVSSPYGLYTLIFWEQSDVGGTFLRLFKDIRNQTNSIKKTMDTREQSVSASSPVLLSNLNSYQWEFPWFAIFRVSWCDTFLLSAEFLPTWCVKWLHWILDKADVPSSIVLWVRAWPR